MPQLNPEFFVSQLFWLCIFFSFLLIFLWKISLPRIAGVLEKRQNKINESLSSAKELQEQAKEVEDNINIQISKAKQETDIQVKEALSLLQDEVTSKLSSLDKELESKIINSEQDIIKSKDNQMKNIDSEIANIAKLTISKISNIKITDEEIDQAIKSNKGVLN